MGGPVQSRVPLLIAGIPVDMCRRLNPRLSLSTILAVHREQRIGRGGLVAVLEASTSEMYMPDQPRTATRTDRLRDRLRYHLDNLLSRGTWAVLLFLGVVVFVVLLASAEFEK